MINGKQPGMRWPVAVKEPHEDGLDDPCARCGHKKREHAQLIDNQTSSASYKPERRHCMHMGVGGCECNTFKETPGRGRRPAGKTSESVEPAKPGQHRPPESAALREVAAALALARAEHPAMRSAHEGCALVREKLDELWDGVKAKHDREKLGREAMQVAAMAIRFMEDLCNEGNE